MIRVPEELSRKFDIFLSSRHIPQGEWGAYRKWLRFYLDFCHKYGHAYADVSSLPVFLAKLASKGQSENQRSQAGKAVNLYYEMLAQSPGGAGDVPQSKSGRSEVREKSPAYRFGSDRERGKSQSSESPCPDVKDAARSEQKRAAGPSHKVAVNSGHGASWQAEFKALENEIRLRHYSRKTLSTYRLWVRKFQAFVASQPPEELSTDDVKAFLTDLAVNQGVASSTQNQAFNALLFFFRHSLGREFGKVDGVVRAKRRPYIPTVLSREEIDQILSRLEAPYSFVVKLMFGCGLRISECLGLRVGCFNLDAGMLTVHDGKGQKDRTVPLPRSLLPEIRERLVELKDLHKADLARGYAGVFLPSQLEKKYKNAPKQFVWQWFFPAKRLSHVVKTGEYRRYHLQPSHVNKALRAAVGQCAIPKRVSAHTFRHSFASHLLQANYDIRTIQELLGHSDVRTTMIYTHTVPSRTLKERKSPLDFSPAEINL